MKSRAMIPLLVGLGIGVFAIRTFVKVLNKAKGEGSGDVVQVVRASSDVGATVEIQESMVELGEVPKAFAPSLAFHDVNEVVGRVTTQVIPGGTAVIPAFLAPKGTPPGMVSRIRDGYRAVAIRVDEIVGVGGWIKPGSRVDVVVVMCGQGAGKSGTVSKVVLQDVEVLAVGPEIESRDPNAAVHRSVTVLIDPKEVTKLNLAASKGKLQLAMRSQLDRARPDSPIVTERDLLSDPPNKKRPSGRDKGSLLARLFRRSQEQTDKTDDGAAAAKVVQLAVAPPLPPRQREWVVQVMSGPVVDEVRFDSDKKGARLLCGGSNEGRAAGARGQGAMLPSAGTIRLGGRPPAVPDVDDDLSRGAAQVDVE